MKISKIKKEQLIEMVNLLNNGVSRKSVADKFNFKTGTIYYFIRKLRKLGVVIKKQDSPVSVFKEVAEEFKKQK